jgi:hypothetical protein
MSRREINAFLNPITEHVMGFLFSVAFLYLNKPTVNGDPFEW